MAGLNWVLADFGLIQIKDALTNLMELLIF